MGVQTVIIKDENFGGGGLLNEFTIDFERPEVTVSDIIKERVRYEVAAYHKKAEDHYRGLVQPTETEKVLNGYKMKKGRRIDLQVQTKTALGAFDENAFLLLINEKQVENLEEKVIIRPNMEIVFLKLTPLVGG